MEAFVGKQRLTYLQLTMGNKMSVLKKSSISTFSFNTYLLHTQDGTSLVTKTVLKSYQPGRGEEKYANNDSIKWFSGNWHLFQTLWEPSGGNEEFFPETRKAADQEIAGNGQVAPSRLFLKGNYAFISSSWTWFPRTMVQFVYTTNRKWISHVLAWA